jgi:hypothetical protein
MKKLKPYIYLATDFLIILTGVAVFAAAFYGIGRKAAQSESIHSEVEREIQDLTEMRVMREWELQQQN